jgi:ribonuclease HII
MSSSPINIPPRLELENIIWKNGYGKIAGIDEVGRGPIAGPVVAAAVIFRPYVFIQGVRDSKKLSSKQREKLVTDIKNNALAYGIGFVEPHEIDLINIRQATFRAMRKAIANLKIQPDYLLFDGYELPEKIYKQEAIVGGDDISFTIASASILAKVTRDQLMLDYHKKYPEYRFDKHKGYGTFQHRVFVKKYGPSPIHRLSFLSKILS